MLSNSDKLLHLFWVIGSLVLFIIFLTTSKFGNDSDVVGYVSFAATIASLILAIIAIFQAMISSQSFTRTIGKMGDAADRLLKNEESFFKSSEDILSRLGEVSKDIKLIDRQTGKLQKRFDEFARKNNSSSPSVEGESPSSLYSARLKLTREQVIAFLQQSSLSGLRALYVLKLAADNNVDFTLEEIASKESSFNINYSYGFLVAASSLNLVDFERDSEGIIKRPWISDDVKSVLEKMYEDRAIELDERFPALPKNAQASKAQLALIFAEKKSKMISASKIDDTKE